MNRKTLFLVVTLVMTCFLISGCVAVAAGAAGGAGTYAWASGKLSFTTNHGIGECHDATIAALNELNINVVSDSTDKMTGRVKGKTPLGESVAVDLEPQGMNVTKIDVRVGFWGNQGQSTKIADSIRRHLR